MSAQATLGSAIRESHHVIEEDRTLVAAVRAGDDEAFGRLYERYRRRITAYAFGFVRDHARAEDVTQDVFLSALRRVRETDQPIAVQPWLYEITRNACVDQHRRSRRHNEVPYDGVESERLVAPTPGPAAAVDAKVRLDDLRHAFRGLSPREHQLLILRDVEGLSYREIAERMQLTRGAVERGLASARLRLVDEYEELSSGTRCRRVQSLISAAGPGHTLGTFERVRIGSHVLHCTSCRVHVRRAGLRIDPGAVPRRLAGLIPLPVWLRRTMGGSAPTPLARAVTQAGTIAPSVGPAWEWPAWVAATAAVASVGLALGVGVGVGHRHGLSPAHSAAPGRAHPVLLSPAPGPASSAFGPRTAAPALLPPSDARAARTVTAPTTPGTAVRPARLRGRAPGGSVTTTSAPGDRPAAAATGHGATGSDGGTAPANAPAAPAAGSGASSSGGSGNSASGVSHRAATVVGTVAPAVAPAVAPTAGRVVSAAPVAPVAANLSGGANRVAGAAGSAVTGAGTAVTQAGNAAAGTVQSVAGAAAGTVQTVTSATPVTAPLGPPVSGAVTAAGSGAAGAAAGTAAGVGAATKDLPATASPTGHPGTALLPSVSG